MTFTPDMLAKLEAQRAEFSGDDSTRARAEVWRDATPAECLAAVDGLCADAAFFLGRLSDDELERVLTPPPLPAQTLELLTALWHQRRP